MQINFRAPGVWETLVGPHMALAALMAVVTITLIVLGLLSVKKSRAGEDDYTKPKILFAVAAMTAVIAGALALTISTHYSSVMNNALREQTKSVIQETYDFNLTNQQADELLGHNGNLEVDEFTVTEWANPPKFDFMRDFGTTEVEWRGNKINATFAYLNGQFVVISGTENPVELPRR